MLSKLCESTQIYLCVPLLNHMHYTISSYIATRRTSRLNSWTVVRIFLSYGYRLILQIRPSSCGITPCKYRASNVIPHTDPGRPAQSTCNRPGPILVLYPSYQRLSCFPQATRVQTGLIEWTNRLEANSRSSSAPSRQQDCTKCYGPPSSSHPDHNRQVQHTLKSLPKTPLKGEATSTRIISTCKRTHPPDLRCSRR